MEIWKQIKGYEGIYEISNQGRVKSCARDLYLGEGKKDLNHMPSVILKQYRQLDGNVVFLQGKKYFVKDLLNNYFK